MAERGVELLCGDGLPPGHDVYWVNGLPSAQTVYDIANLKRKGKKLVWSVDDDWLSIPDWNPAAPGEGGMVTYLLMKLMADHVVCSTRHLASTFQGQVKVPVHVAPNLLDLSRFPKPQYIEDHKTKTRFMTLTPKTPVRVVWVGSHTHSGDIKELVEPLEQFCDKFLPARKADLVFMGMSPPAQLLSKYLHQGLYHQQTVPLSTYQAVINSIDSHVYLAPLAQIPFNLSKSALRIMEGWGLMAAPVATDWGEYSTIAHREDGLLVETPEQWSTALDRLVTDHEYRVRLALSGRQRVEQTMNWAVADCRDPWINTFSKICEV